MAYDAVNDLAGMDATRPVGSTETVAILDDALRETRLCLKTVVMAEHDSVGAHKAATLTHAMLADNAVEDNNIKDGEVTLVKLATGVLSGANITAASIPTTAYVAASVTDTVLASNAVIEAKIAAGAVTNTKLGTGAVTVAKMSTELATAVMLIGQVDGTYAQQVISGDATVSATGLMTVALRGVFISDQKAFGTAGGTCTTGSFLTRDLNSTDSDLASLSTLVANQITLALGKYLCIAFCPAHNVGVHRARLYNVTSAAQVLLGQTAVSNSPAVILGLFEVTNATHKYEIQHYGTVTQATDGFGFPFNIAGNVETYTQVMFFKVA